VRERQMAGLVAQLEERTSQVSCSMMV
jgi:hypothetical protein